MAATNAQVQAFVDSRVRQRCEQIRALYTSLKDDLAVIGDVYANLTNSPDWTDNRTDGPPHLAVPNDVLAFNTAASALIAVVEGGATSAMDDFAPQYPVILNLCVRPVSQGF